MPAVVPRPHVRGVPRDQQRLARVVLVTHALRVRAWQGGGVWVGRWVDGWMGGWVGGWVDGWACGWVDRWKGGWVGGWGIDAWMDG